MKEAITLPRRTRSAAGFAKHCAGVAKYWAELPNQTPLQIAEGVAFSILVAIDGDALGVAAMALRPLNEIGDEGRDIAGALQNHFIKAKRRVPCK